MRFWQGRFADATVAQEQTRICWEEPRKLAPDDYYFMDPAVQGLIAQMELALVKGQHEAWGEARRNNRTSPVTVPPR